MLLRIFLLRTLVVLVACHGVSGKLVAQDFKVYTPVFNMAAPETPPRAGKRPQHPIIARSSLYFHANKAYDHIEATGEVQIYEPNAQRFTILYPARDMATTLTFDELDRMVREAEIKAHKRVLRSKEEHQDQSSRIGMIEFQLQPTFKERFDRQTTELDLSSAFMSYQVQCVVAESPERMKAYLTYCDWAARLNFVLDPQAPLPGPRLTLNESLRKRGLMPVGVSLQASIGSGLRLRAEHTIDWKLDPHDRDRIHQWQTKLESKETRQVSFRQFQEVLVAERK